MEPSYFFFLILPLGILVFFLVAIIVYNSRKEEDEYKKEVKKLRQLLFSGKLDMKTFLNMKNKLKHEQVFLTESKKLFTLLSDEKIDEGTTDPTLKEPFDISKFWSIEKQNSHCSDSSCKSWLHIEDRDAQQFKA